MILEYKLSSVIPTVIPMVAMIKENSPICERLRLIEIAVAEFEEENKNKSRNAADEETTTTNNQIKSGITRNTTF